MEGNEQQELKRFSSPEEEIQHLHAQVATKERELRTFHENMPTKHELVSDEIKEYARSEPKEVLSEEHQMKVEDIEHHVLHLKSGHDEKI